MDEAEIRSNIGRIMPALKANLYSANKKMDLDTIDYQDFVDIIARFQLAEDIVNSDICDLTEAFEAASLLTIDLRTAARDFPVLKLDLDVWLLFLHDSGLTEYDSSLNVPRFASCQP